MQFCSRSTESEGDDGGLTSGLLEEQLSHRRGLAMRTAPTAPKRRRCTRTITGDEFSSHAAQCDVAFAC
jgi:hypothetical protein